MRFIIFGVAGDSSLSLFPRGAHLYANEQKTFIFVHLQRDDIYKTLTCKGFQNWHNRWAVFEASDKCALNHHLKLSRYAQKLFKSRIA